VLIVLCLLAFLGVALAPCEAPAGSEQEIVLLRDTTAGRVALGGILVIMLIVFVRRFLRVRRAFKDLQE
jgi:hypothetical protein